MAACLITISGTSGKVEIDYKISTVAHRLIADIGTLYIEDTATNVTYTTISGDAVASSTCLTINNLPIACYKITWTGMIANGYRFNAILLGNEIISIAEVIFPETSLSSLANSVNSAGDSRVKISAYKLIALPNTTNSASVIYNILFKIIGTQIPILRIRNADTTSNIYLHGETSACSIAGYTNVNVCETEPAPLV